MCFGRSVYVCKGEEGKMREVGVGNLVSEQYLANTKQDCFHFSQDKHVMPSQYSLADSSSPSNLNRSTISSKTFVVV